jgi:hypothetical protein
MLSAETSGKGNGAFPSGLSDLLNEVKRYGILNTGLDDLDGLIEQNRIP